MRGEHKAARRIVPHIRGSSPHARGALGNRDVLRFKRGIIPACAGSTRPSRPRRAALRDHPRMRGEHGFLFCGSGSSPGSSPHARGAQGQGEGREADAGIIPACAGSTRCEPASRAPGKDHPRMRGEHFRPVAVLGTCTGSSPHARGAPSSPVRQAKLVGIIPACAGSTPHRRRARGRVGDHPRMRGEHSRVPSGRELRVGSSPHARGAHGAVVVDGGDHGIIPACAGSTPSRAPATTARRDHPRMRGEHEGMTDERTFWWGSSPHARGAHERVQILGFMHGIIPACAGSTRHRIQRQLLTRDHPRMRGEHPQ